MNIPEGWPTKEMIDAGERIDPNDYAAKGAWVQTVLEAALAAAPTPPAPEVEPAGRIHRIELSEMVSVGVNLTANGEMLPDGTNLYTHPANDGLRKAAEDVLAEYESHIASGRPLPYWAIKTLENLRAELDKGK